MAGWAARLLDWFGWLLCEAAFRTDCRGPMVLAYRAGCWCYGKAHDIEWRSEASEVSRAKGKFVEPSLDTLRGDARHYCPDWDYMAIDDTMPEIECCTCDKATKKAGR